MLKSGTQGREVILAFNGDVGAALRKACEHNADGDAVHLARAVTIVRRDMFSTTCQEKSVPNSLIALVTMVLNGPNIKSRSSNVSQAALSLSQLLLYNSVKRYKENDTDIVDTANNEKHLYQSI